MMQRLDAETDFKCSCLSVIFVQCNPTTLIYLLPCRLFNILCTVVAVLNSQMMTCFELVRGR